MRLTFLAALFLTLAPAVSAGWEIVPERNVRTGATKIIVKAMSEESAAGSTQIGLALTCGEEAGIGMMLWIPGDEVHLGEDVYFAIDDDKRFKFPLEPSSTGRNPVFEIEPVFFEALEKGYTAILSYRNADGTPRSATFDLIGFTKATRSLDCSPRPTGDGQGS